MPAMGALHQPGQGGWVPKQTQYKEEGKPSIGSGSPPK